jgi:hypothetical protein
MKPTYKEVNELLGALAALGAKYSKILKEGSRETAIDVPYKYGAKSQAVRSAAAHNLRLLKPHAETYGELRDALLIEITDGRGYIRDETSDEELAISFKFHQAEQALLKTPVPVELELLPIAESDLDLANNPIPPAVVAALAVLEKPAKPAAAEPAETDA